MSESAGTGEPAGIHPPVGGGEVRVRATPANHTGFRPPFGPQGGCLGFVVEGSARIYFAGDTDLFPEMDALGPIDVALFYVPPHIGEQVIADVAAKQIPEVWLNPGAESDALIAKARSLHLKPIVACSIVGIGKNPDAL